MKKSVAITAALLLLAGLSGCVQSTEDPATVKNAETSEAAPLTAEQPEPEAPVADTPEAQYLAAVRESLDPETTQIPDATDEQLLAAGQDACEQIESGKQPNDVRVVEGEQPDSVGYFVDSRRIALSATETIC